MSSFSFFLQNASNLLLRQVKHIRRDAVWRPELTNKDLVVNDTDNSVMKIA